MFNGLPYSDYNYFTTGQAYLRSPDIRVAGPAMNAVQTATTEESMPSSIETGAVVGHHVHRDTCHHNFDYKPGTVVWNLNKILRKCGIPVPTKYCTKMWFVKDCAGYMAVSFTWAFILVGELMIIMNCFSTNNVTILSYANIIFTITLALLAFLSHCQSMFTDPGAVPQGDATEENISKLDFSNGKQVLRCVKCNSIKPDRAHHCSTCQRCILKMDHHCPWINNCVGEYNQKYFVLFTGYVCLLSCYGFIVSLSTLVSCLSSAFAGCYYSPTITLLICVGLLMESLLFGIFTAIMCGTQLSSICSDQTGIESLKREKRKRKTCRRNLKEVFGGSFSYKWFSPFHGSLESYNLNNNSMTNDNSVYINF